MKVNIPEMFQLRLVAVVLASRLLGKPYAMAIA